MDLVRDLRLAALEHETLSPLLNEAADEIARLRPPANAARNAQDGSDDRRDHWITRHYDLEALAKGVDPMITRIELAAIAHGGE